MTCSNYSKSKNIIVVIIIFSAQITIIIVDVLEGVGRCVYYKTIV